MYTAEHFFFPNYVCFLYLCVPQVRFSFKFQCMSEYLYFYSTVSIHIVGVCVYLYVSRSGGRIRRADPCHLRQEDSDAVWNELAYFKNQTRKLLTEK